MKNFFKEIEKNKLLLKISNNTYEPQAVFNASYKYTDKCYINIEQIDGKMEILFQSKNNDLDLENIALEFGNELIDQQIRLNTSREFKSIREELVKKAFASIS